VVGDFDRLLIECGEKVAQDGEGNG
jgi:hypothetical protein